MLAWECYNRSGYIYFEQLWAVDDNISFKYILWSV